MDPNILVPSVPVRLRITQGMIEDMLCDPVLGATILLNQKLDAFQKVRLKTTWWSPRCIDSSGLSSAKTHNMVMVSVMRCILLEDHISAIIYQNFEAGKAIYANFIQAFAAQSQIFLAQMGRERLLGFDSENKTDVGKSQHKRPSCWEWKFRNGSIITMPAPDHLKSARGQAGKRWNSIFLDEWTKSEAGGGSGIDDQLIGRTSRKCFNQEHPIYCNHHLFLATAEDQGHPGYVRYSGILRATKKGDPEKSVISFNFKDYSGIKFDEESTFKEKFRDKRMIEDLRRGKTRSGFLQEALGIWSKNGRGLYTTEMIERAKSVGAMQGADYYCSRQEDPEGEKAFYFAGIDPAPAKTEKADDGAIVVLRAVPMTSGISDDARTYKVSPCFAYKVRRASVEQWGGIITLLHQRFGFTGIMLDPQGGGTWIQDQLKKDEQKVRGVTTRVMPIATIEEEQGLMTMADFILTVFRPKDARVQQTWATQALGRWGPENLTDAMHYECCEAFNSGVFAFPPSYRDCPKEKRALWNDEKRCACAWITDPRKGLGAQLIQIFVETDDAGQIKHTKGQSPARSFSSRMRKDFAYAFAMAHMRFLIWLRTNKDDLQITEEDAAMGGGSER